MRGVRSETDIKDDIDEIIEEIADIERMPDDEAATKFNVDSKEQILAIDNEWLDSLYKELEDAASVGGRIYDPADEIFGSHLAMDEYLF